VLNKRTIIVAFVAIFSAIESTVTLSKLFAGVSTLSGTTTAASSSAPSIFWTYSLHLSAAGWVAVGLVLLQGRVGRNSRIRSTFARMGFDGDVYNLMIGMRGSSSRLALLESMETPRHRLELSEITGIDWKEVDRQVAVLEKFGLVKVHAQSGTMRLFQITEQGKVIIKLVEELNDK
jgi:DNA-binding transcriptional ArsR family regulator